MEPDRSERSAPLRGCIDSSSLRLQWSEAALDTVIYGRPVLQITNLEIRGPTAAQELAAFELARDAVGSGLVSCRLPHDRLRESMLLETAGFRFIEMLYLPELDPLKPAGALGDGGLEVRRASLTDLPRVLQIAGTAFGNERFHVDPRLRPEHGNQRYRNWASSSLSHPSQRMFVVCDGPLLVAFFVTEDLPDGTCYWHLNAVATELQGRGYRRRAWSAMIHQASANGSQRVRTSVVARNHRVLNLYARLGFRFPAPMMTFHWVRED